MMMNVTPLDERTALQMELGRPVDDVELLEWLVDGSESLSTRAARALRGCNLDLVLASLEATLMEKLEMQDAVYGRLADMLGEPFTNGIAVELLEASTSPTAAAFLQSHPTRTRRTA